LCVFLDGNERTLKKRIIDNIGFAAFSADNPLPLLHINEPKIGSNRLRLCALNGVHDYRSRCTIPTHDDPQVALLPTLIYLIKRRIKGLRLNRKGIVGRHSKSWRDCNSSSLISASVLLIAGVQSARFLFAEIS
jgi:hypothetical protein